MQDTILRLVKGHLPCVFPMTERGNIFVQLQTVRILLYNSVPWQSSAKRRISESIFVSVSSIKSKKSKGARIVTCGTPDETGTSPFWGRARVVRNHSIQPKTLPLILIPVCPSFRKCLWCGTLSNGWWYKREDRLAFDTKEAVWRNEQQIIKRFVLNVDLIERTTIKKINFANFVFSKKYLPSLNFESAYGPGYEPAYSDVQDSSWCSRCGFIKTSY